MAIHLLNKWKNGWMRNHGILNFVCLLEVMLNVHSKHFPYRKCQFISGSLSINSLIVIFDEHLKLNTLFIACQVCLISFFKLLKTS